MKTLLIVLLMSFSSMAFSQTPDGIYQYCQVKIIGKTLSRKVSIEVDYGQEQKLFDKSAVVKDSAGNVRVFNSMADALNYMGSLGWRVVQVFSKNEDPSISTGYHYLMESRKRVN